MVVWSSRRAVALLALGFGLQVGSGRAADSAPAPTKSIRLSDTNPAARTSIRVSDSTNGVVRSGITLPPPLFSSKPDGLRQRGSSLDGVGAAPFAPSIMPMPAMPTRRDRDNRDTRSNWMTDPGANYLITDDNANRAMGVRRNELDSPDQGFDRRSSVWNSVLQQPDKTRINRPETPGLDSRKANLNPEPLDRYHTLIPLGFDNPSQPFPGRNRERVTISDGTGRSPFANGSLDNQPEGRRDLVRDNLNYSGPVPGAKPDARATSRAEQFRRILDDNPVLPNGAGESAAARSLPSSEVANPSRQGSALDLVNAIPDPTRKELNPVIARPAPELRPGTSLTFSESLYTARPNAPTARRSLVDPSPITGFGPATLGSAETAPITPYRRMMTTPTTLDVPRRGF